MIYKNNNSMEKNSKLKGKALTKAMNEARKDPQFIREINKFIKITTGVYKLKDYGLDKLK